MIPVSKGLDHALTWYLPIEDFLGISLIETGLSDHNHLNCFIIKSWFSKREPKQVIYRNYKHFQWQDFETDLKSSLNNCNRNFDEKAFTTALNLHARKKVKALRENHKLHLNKKLRKAIIERSRLENKLNKSIYNVSYKKQGNLVDSSNRQSNLDCFDSIFSW